MMSALFLTEPARFEGSLLKRSNSGEPGTLDPHLANKAPEVIIVNDLFLGLMTYDHKGKIVPGAASEYTVSDDGLIWTFTLRRDLRWSDGVPMTSEDFIYSFRRSMTPETASPSASYLYSIKNAKAVNSGEMSADMIGVSAPDDYTIVFTLETSTPYFDRLLVVPAAIPVPKHVIARHGTGWSRPPNAVSNGAFILDSWAPQVGIRVLKNPEFFEKDTVNLDGVEYVPTEDLGTQLKRFRAGEIDIGLNYPPTKTEWVKENLQGSLRLFPILGTYYYALNLSTPNLKDTRVRRALSISVDRKLITSKLLHSGEQPAYGLVAPAFEYYPAEPSSAYSKQSIEERTRQAKELLAAAGFDATNPLKVEIRYNMSEEHQAIAVTIANMWKSIGVEPTLLNTEARNHYKDLAIGQFEVGRSAKFASYDDPMSFLAAYSIYAKGDNYSGYANPVFESRIDAANKIADPVKRGAALKQAELLALSDFPVIPIYHYVSKRLVSRRVTGWQNNPSGTHLTRYLGIKSE